MSCPHGEVHPQACVECMEGVPAERPAPRWRKRGEPFTAKYVGWCRGCRAEWAQGDRLQAWEQVEPLPSGGTRVLDTRYSHADC